MKSVIIGAGSYGLVYLSYLREAGVEIAGFIDDNTELHNTMIDGVPVLGGKDLLPTLRKSHGIEAVYCPIGNNKVRVKLLLLARELGYKTPGYIHPSVVVSPNAVVGEGVYILPNSSIMPYTKLGDFTMISIGVNVAHHATLDRGVFLSNGCNFGALVKAGEYAYCGMGSTIMSGIGSIGRNTLIGAGTVVVKELPDDVVVAGVPAKILRKND